MQMEGMFEFTASGILENINLEPLPVDVTCQAFFYRFWENPTFSPFGNFHANYLIQMVGMLTASWTPGRILIFCICPIFH